MNARPVTPYCRVVDVETNAIKVVVNVDDGGFDFGSVTRWRWDMSPAPEKQYRHENGDPILRPKAPLVSDKAIEIARAKVDQAFAQTSVSYEVHQAVLAGVAALRKELDNERRKNMVLADEAGHHQNGRRALEVSHSVAMRLTNDRDAEIRVLKSRIRSLEDENRRLRWSRG